MPASTGQRATSQRLFRVHGPHGPEAPVPPPPRTDAALSEVRRPLMFAFFFFPVTKRGVTGGGRRGFNAAGEGEEQRQEPPQMRAGSSALPYMLLVVSCQQMRATTEMRDEWLAPEKKMAESRPRCPPAPGQRGAYRKWAQAALVSRSSAGAPAPAFFSPYCS